MKNQFLILTCASLVAIQSAQAAPKIGSWAYILHTARLSNEYLEATIPRYSVSGTTGFKLTAEGILRTESTPLMKQVIYLTEKHRISRYPVISFSSADAGHRLLNSKSGRVRAIQSIAALAGEHKFSGIHLDFEYLPPEDAGN